MKDLTIVNAYENNLKNISVSIKNNSITVINGINGSGKSTLVKSVIFGEYLRQERLQNKNTDYDLLVRPKFDSIVNPYKTIYISQKSPKQTEKSNVSTVSGVNKLLKKQLVSNGEIWCNKCSAKVNEVASEEIIKALLRKHPDAELRYNLITHEYPNEVHLREKLKTLKSNSILIAGQRVLRDANYIQKLNVDKKLTIECIINFESFNFSVITDFKKLKFYSKGELIYDFSKQTFCACLKEYYTKRPPLFSTSTLGDFNGSCPKCEGRGYVTKVDFDSLINEKPLDSTFLNLPHNGTAYKYCYIQDSDIRKIVKSFSSSLHIPFAKLERPLQEEVKRYIEPKLLSKATNSNISNYIKKGVCDCCEGTGFNYQSRAVTYKGLSIADMLSMDIDTLSNTLKLDQLEIINEKFKLLGLPKFELSRCSTTLSGGELQRLKLIKYLADEIEGSLIIIDEPSKGLSVQDISNLFIVLRDLSQKNTVLLVDHSEYVIKNSDYSLTLGPYSGVNGGYISESLPSFINFPEPKKLSSNEICTFEGINYNFVKDQNVNILLNGLNAIFGISGSGKSSLAKGLFDIVQTENKHFQHKALLEQTEISGNIRSTVASYLKISEPLRVIFASQPISRSFCLNKEHFSSNTEAGMCKVCNGTGFVDSGRCQSCLGTKLIPLSNYVYFGNYTLNEYLSMTVVELKNSQIYVEFEEVIELLISLGLGHLSLGRTTSTLSGGESQRLKMAKYLIEMATVINSENVHVLMLLDEPMRGLSDQDSLHIFSKLKSLTHLNNTILIIEHNPKVVMSCDYLIEVGPKAGELGGKVIFNDYSTIYHLDVSSALRFNTVTSLKNLDVETFHFNEEDVAFLAQKEFNESFRVKDIVNTKIFYDKQSLIEAINLEVDSTYYFNPLYPLLLNSSSVPYSELKSITTNLVKLGFESCLVDEVDVPLRELPQASSPKNFWDILIPTKSLELAFELGAGVIILRQNGDFNYYSLRVIDNKNHVIGSRLDKLDDDFFNLYFHKCPQCSGSGKLEIIQNLELDTTKAYTDLSCYPIFLQKDMEKLFFRLKEALNKLSSEKIFDSNMSICELSKDDHRKILFGVSGLSFLKNSGRKNAKEDMIEWEGLYQFILKRLSKFSAQNRKFIEHNITTSTCYQCNGSKYKMEFNYYICKGKNIWE
ncbi:ATP-binding cassette domain-containing protein [Pseudoalteromonas sp. 120-MNA-CIBAN-0494]|uniref:ATP-binding cassette domain-containing protein n=1 Tax=unclassified Pseudoalteromonas TaxID=194690 RepID=UPI0033251502